MDWFIGVSNFGLVIEELVYIGMCVELLVIIYMRVIGVMRGVLFYCIYLFIELFYFFLFFLFICLRKFEYLKNCLFIID